MRWGRAAVAATKLPEDAKEFLAEVGLPHVIDWDIHFGPEGMCLGELPAESGRYIIGGEYPWICLDATMNGRVIAILSKLSPDQTQFVNQDVRRFSEFLVLYQKYRLSVEGLSQEHARELVDQTKREMESREADAVTISETFWHSIIEEMYMGWM